MTYTKPPGVHPQSFSRGCGLSERDSPEMKWFKHYENAHTNNLIQAIISGKNGLENGMRYWLLLEFLCREFKKDTTEFVISKRRLMDHLRFRQGAKLIEFLELLTSYSEVFDELLFSYTEVTSEFSQNFLKIKTPIILELMGKDFKRARHCRGNDTAKNKEERRKKEKHIGARDLCAEKIGKVVNPDQAMMLWNEILIPKGFEPARYYPNSKLKDFIFFSKAVGGMDEWRKLIESISDSWLAKAESFSFSWFFDEDKAAKILNGQYNTARGEVSKTKLKSFFTQGEIDD